VTRKLHGTGSLGSPGERVAVVITGADVSPSQLDG
jgi:hypothetical protein